MLLAQSPNDFDDVAMRCRVRESFARTKLKSYKIQRQHVVIKYLEFLVLWPMEMHVSKSTNLFYWEVRVTSRRFMNDVRNDVGAQRKLFHERKEICKETWWSCYRGKLGLEIQAYLCIYILLLPHLGDATFSSNSTWYY